MKKMEVMMELLTEEIDSFNKSISKLEELSENFKNIKIKADTSDIKYYVREFLGKQEKSVIFNMRKTTEMNQVMKSARIVPNWLATLFCIVISIQVLSLSYFAHHFIRFEDRHAAAFEAGLKESSKRVQEYFEDHPIIHENFQKWNRKKNTGPNQE